MEISKEHLEEFKKIYKKEFGKEISNQEAYESTHNLLGFFELLIKIERREHFRRERLKNEPKGFHLEEDGGVYNCIVCHKHISGKEGWWDECGQKCLDCQRMIDKKVIPKSVCKDRDSWYEDWELKDKFGLHYQTVSKLIKEGKLKARELKNKNRQIYLRIFLKKENKDFV